MALALVVGCGKPNPALRAQRPSEVLDFATLFKQNCAGCHGMDGNLGPAPPLNDPLFLTLLSDESMEEIIAQGRRGTLMPSFGESQGGFLTRAQTSAIAKGIREAWGKSTAETASELPALFAINAPMLGDSDRGQRVFARACARCHGSEGKGGSAGALNDTAFLALVSDQLLRRIVITGRPDLGMPNYCSQRLDAAGAPDPLGEQDVADVVEYVKSWRMVDDPSALARTTR